MFSRQETEPACEVTEASLVGYEVSGYPSGRKVGGFFEKDRWSRHFESGDLEVGDVYVADSGCNVLDLQVEGASTVLTPLGFVAVGTGAVVLVVALGALVALGIVKFVQRLRGRRQTVGDESGPV